MKKNFGRHPANLLIGSTLIIVAVALLSSGCKKAQPPISTEQVSTASQTNPADTDHTPVYQPSSAVAPAGVPPVAGPDLGELNRGMIRWIVANRRRPNNFEDFAATANMVIPPPPTGKKYVIDSTMHIQLVNR